MQEPIAVAVEGDELEQLATVMGNGVGKRAWFRHGERVVKAELVPWLPGVDHREQLAAGKRRGEGKRKRR